MVTMAERIKGLEINVDYLKENNNKQSKDIESILSKLNCFILAANKTFAAKDTETKVELLMRWRYYISGIFAVIIFLLSFIKWG